jgi:hypothetical protein
MGYTTEFIGKFNIDKNMPREFVEYINRFSSTRRMKRKTDKIKEIYPNWPDLCFAGKQLGEEGEYLAIISNNYGQDSDDSIVDYNRPPATQPGLWCQWIIETNEDLKNNNINEFTGKLVWDGGEKFYEYTDWLEYMIKHFFIPMNLTLNGAVLAVGENSDDATYIVINENNVTTFNALNKYSVKQIENEFSSNKMIMENMSKIKKTPDEIRDEFWDWDEEDEEW